MKEIKNKIEQSNYWDARVKALECKYFGDEVIIVFEGDDSDVMYNFEECYDVRIKHLIEYSKETPCRNLILPQIPYFLQDIEANELNINDIIYFEFKIRMFPIELYIVCKKLDIK